MIGTNGIKKKELKAETKLAHTNESVYRSGKNKAIATLEPAMHIKIHFLYTPLRRCIGPIIITPMIPEIIGLPPTIETAAARFSENQGLSMNDKVIEIPLKIPKKHPKATNSLM